MDLANLYPTDLPLRDSRRSRGPPSQTGSLEISESLTENYRNGGPKLSSDGNLKPLRASHQF